MRPTIAFVAAGFLCTTRFPGAQKHTVFDAGDFGHSRLLRIPATDSSSLDPRYTHFP
jgi:hypothetical protein